uniref:Protein MIX23 n=2 Tax=Macrostomum lignano TaxID=282301 RepID=A0A1I8FWY1_9PLAT
MAPDNNNSTTATLHLPCDDIIQFKKQLESARKVDDRIQNELNSRLPASAYFRSKVDPRRVCQELFESLRCAHSSRDSAIKRCINLTEQEVRSMLGEAGQDKAKGGAATGTASGAIGKSQSRLRQLRNDLYEEEIIQRNTYKFLYERCRDIYVPTDLPTDLKFSTGFVYDERMTLHKHDWNPKFNEAPERITTTHARLCELGLVQRCERISAEPITDEDILRLHSPELLQLLKDSQQMSDEEQCKLREKFDEAPLSVHTHDAARLSAGGLLKLTQAVLDGKLLNGFALIRPPGHHAMRDDFNGFCYLNNVCLSALKALSSSEGKRILIVDWDVHHGQGIQQAFYNSSDVLYISIHRYERGEHWPNLREGDYDFVGIGNGLGYNVNVPLNEIGLSNAEYLAIFHNLILPIATEFSPDLVFVSAGFDCAIGCPLGEMRVHPACFAHFTHYLMSLANGRIVIALEGGYCLSSLSEGVAMTVRTLLGDACPRLEALGEPSDSIKETLLNCLTALRPYWKCLRMQGSTGDMLIPDISHLSLNSTHATKLKYPWVEYNPELTPEQLVAFAKEVDRLTALADLRPADADANNYRTCLAYDVKMCRHENLLDRSHPELPRRIVYIYDQLCAKGLSGLCRFASSRRCTDEEAMLFHTRDNLDMMAAWRNLDSESDRFAELQSRFDSLYVHPLSYDAAQLSCGTLLSVVEEVCSGRSRNGYAIVRPPGHHAESDKPRGFCFINNVVVAARYAQTKHSNKVRRVLILDWDVHHGNGVQDAFYSDDSVLYISLHRYDFGRFYPGSSGAKENVGCDKGLGYNVNVPWNGRVGDAEYLAAFHHIVLPIAQSFNPDLVLVSAGFDAAVGDPLGGLKLTPACYGHLAHLLCGLAGGRVVLALEGGYNLASIGEASCHCVASLLGLPPLQLPKQLVPNPSHVTRIADGRGVDARAVCQTCSDGSENWLCLACLETHCGRYVSKHMLSHSESTGHVIALSFSDLSVWCYHCDSYIVSPVVEPFIAAAARSKFGE